MVYSSYRWYMELCDPAVTTFGNQACCPDAGKTAIVPIRDPRTHRWPGGKTFTGLSRTEIFSNASATSPGTVIITKIYEEVARKQIDILCIFQDPKEILRQFYRRIKVLKESHQGAIHQVDRTLKELFATNEKMGDYAIIGFVLGLKRNIQESMNAPHEYQTLRKARSPTMIEQEESRVNENLILGSSRTWKIMKPPTGEPLVEYDGVSITDYPDTYHPD